MRIIAGECRGRKIDGPTDDQTRPTSDAVRESIFNILKGRIDGAVAVDLFAGSGALGLEAISRGADRAIFVEINRENVALIRKNANTLGYGDRSKVLLSDAHRFGRAYEVEGDEPLLIFLDPPYLEYQRHSSKIGGLIQTLLSKCPPGSTVVVESGKHWNESLLPDVESWDIRRYGGTVVAFRFLDGTSEAGADEDVVDGDEA